MDFPVGPASLISPLSADGSKGLRVEGHLCLLNPEWTRPHTGGPVATGGGGPNLAPRGDGNSVVQLRDRVGLLGRPNRIERARRGDEAAWGEIYRDLAGPVTGYLAGLGVTDAEDIAGEVFLQVARDIHKFEGTESSFRSWVFVIAHRRAIDWRRAAQRRPPTADHEMPELAGGDVEAEAMELVDADQVIRLLDRLSDDQRDVIALRVIGDLSLEETAAVMGKTVGAVKALQHRAIRAMRDDLEHGEVTL